MTKLKFNLPPYRLRLTLQIDKRRGFSWKGLKPDEVKSFIHKAFAHRNIKKILGTNLTFALILTSFVPTYGSFEAEVGEAVISDTEVHLTTERGVQIPTPIYKINQGYHLFHPGVDLDGEVGDPVKPIKPGKVEAISHSKDSYGNAVTINHGNGYTSLYGHLAEIEVEPGQEVASETEIGKLGSTGRSTGPHLHLEIRQNGRPVNPLGLIL